MNGVPWWRYSSPRRGRLSLSGGPLRRREHGRPNHSRELPARMGDRSHMGYHHTWDEPVLLFPVPECHGGRGTSHKRMRSVISLP